jgi:hypothetical protein
MLSHPSNTAWVFYSRASSAATLRRERLEEDSLRWEILESQRRHDPLSQEVGPRSRPWALPAGGLAVLRGLQLGTTVRGGGRGILRRYGFERVLVDHSWHNFSTCHLFLRGLT